MRKHRWNLDVFPGVCESCGIGYLMDHTTECYPAEEAQRIGGCVMVNLDGHKQDALDAALKAYKEAILTMARGPANNEFEQRTLELPVEIAHDAVRKAKMEMGEEGVVEELLYGERIVSVQTLKPGDRVWVTKVEE